AVLAEFHQPLCRGDDAVCGSLRRHVPAAAHGASVAVLLDVPLSQYHELLAAIPQPAGMGRVCGFDLCDDFGPVLVRGIDPRPGDPARPRHRALGQESLWAAGDGLAWFGAALEPLR